MEILVDRSYDEESLASIPLEELARFVIEQEEKPSSTEVSISFVSNDEIAELNSIYRHKEGPTDVLSFECDNLEDEFASIIPLEEDIYELGDIVIAPDVARAQMDRYGNTFEGEITLLVVHGLLHLCGYDHIENDEAVHMESRERALLSAWSKRGHVSVNR